MHETPVPSAAPSIDSHRRRAPGWAPAVAATTAGCAGDQVSDRSLRFVLPRDAEQLVTGQSGLLGLGGASAAVWVDPRGEEAYRAGHIPGAIHLPFSRVSVEHTMLEPYDVILVYGDEFNDPIAQGMSKRLLQLGHRDVRTLRGGLRAWTADGRALEADDGTPTER